MNIGPISDWVSIAALLVSAGSVLVAKGLDRSTKQIASNFGVFLPEPKFDISLERLNPGGDPVIVITPMSSSAHIEWLQAYLSGNPQPFDYNHDGRPNLPYKFRTGATAQIIDDRTSRSWEPEIGKPNLLGLEPVTNNNSREKMFLVLVGKQSDDRFKEAFSVAYPLDFNSL